jgi:SAM-dependent methyltransferase
MTRTETEIKSLEISNRSALVGRDTPFTNIEHSSPYPLKRDRYSSHSIILSYLPGGPGRLLDVGAAQGDLAQLFTQRGYDVTAIEGDPMLAEAARGKCHEIIVVDLEKPLPDLPGPFDVVVFGDVLEHLKNPLNVLVAVSKLAKPDGNMIVSVPNVAHVWLRLQLFLGRFEYAERGILDATHLRFFTLASFKQLLSGAGLEILKLDATPVPLPLMVPERYQGRTLDALHSVNAALARAWKTMLGYQFVALTRRGASI